MTDDHATGLVKCDCTDYETTENGTINIEVQSVHSRNLPGWDEEPTHTMEISLIDILIFGNERERVINAVSLFMTYRKDADSLFGNGMVDCAGPLEETMNNHILE